MSPACRALSAALLLVASSETAVAQPMPADTAPLEFHGFRAGASLAELQSTLQTLGGGRLHCDRAKADRRVSECRASITDVELGERVNREDERIGELESQLPTLEAADAELAESARRMADARARLEEQAAEAVRNQE